MCGRIAQARDVLDYLNSIGLPESKVFDNIPIPYRFNVTPGSRSLVIHMLAGVDHPIAESIRWRYHSGWAKKSNRGPDINATIEKALSSYWKPLWKKGRVIVPADGWYEWTGDKNNRLPWFVRKKNEQPMFIAAISNWRADPAEQSEGSYFAIVTSESLGGVVDVHDQRPIVLSATDAQKWLDMNFSAEHAENLARTAALATEEFDYYRVPKAVFSAKNDGPDLIEPTDAA